MFIQRHFKFTPDKFQHQSTWCGEWEQMSLGESHRWFFLFYFLKRLSPTFVRSGENRLENAILQNLTVLFYTQVQPNCISYFEVWKLCAEKLFISAHSLFQLMPLKWVGISSYKTLHLRLYLTTSPGWLPKQVPAHICTRMQREIICWKAII